MAYEAITTHWGNPWEDKISSLGSGHYALFYPGNSNVAAGDQNTLVLYDGRGVEVARQAGALNSFSLAVAPNNEIVATVVRFDGGTPVARWRTGVFVAAAPAPTQPAPTGTQLDRIEAGVNAIKAHMGI